MGKRKPKEAESTSQNYAITASSDLFNSLFGAVTVESSPISSLFSEENPFRRKPREPPSVPNSEDVHVLDSELKMTKRKKEGQKKSNVDLVSASEEEAKTAPDTPLVAEKSKKGKSGNVGDNLRSDLESSGTSRKDKGKAPVSDFDAVGDVDHPNLDNKRKKRKRDEIEKEYEEKKYGVSSKDEGQVKAKGEVSGGKKLVGEKRKKADDATDTMVSKEGFDDESKLLRTVFVGNLPVKVKKKSLLKEFSMFGEVESLRIRSVPILDSKKSRKGAIMQKQINEQAASVHAYIVFKREEHAEASLAHNMAMVGGNHIRVDRACPPRKKLKGQNIPLYDNNRTVFVGNLPFDVKDEELYELFSRINNLESSVEAVRVVRDPHLSVGKGIAYVLFKTREAANMVIKKRNLKLRDRELRLSRATSNSTPTKRKNPSTVSEANSPGKKLATDLKDRGSTTKTSMSYQGLRATKSNTKKMKNHPKGIGPTPIKFKSEKKEKPKDRKEKRPAVAARKAKARAMKDGSTPKQAGLKRKLDSRTTPESFNRKKKVKRF